MERSEIRGITRNIPMLIVVKAAVDLSKRHLQSLVRFPDCASLHPGYAGFDFCVSIMQREMSDYVGGYRTCCISACRRARRCASISRDCITTMPRIPLSAFEQSCAIEDILQEILRRRRERRTQKPS